MADETNSQLPQGAIPPKAVPPQIRTSPAGASTPPTVHLQATAPQGATPTSVPRTVRLKPVGAVPAAPSVPRGAPSPLDIAGSVEATDAIKRMTARIAMLAEEDIEKKSSTGPVAMDSFAGDGNDDSTATVKKMTSRIQMTSTTVPIPDLTETPKTIRIRPHASPSPGNDMAALVGPSGTQPVTVKSKTSRLPLESAQPAGGAMNDETSDAAPRTIKLKRPGDMSTVKVPAQGAPAAAAVNDLAANNQPITQKKTIRVKRPAMPAAASVAEGGAADDAGHSAMPIAFATPAPERGTGWFIALSIACILMIIGLAGLFAVQLYGSSPRTELDRQFQKG